MRRHYQIALTGQRTHPPSTLIHPPLVPEVGLLGISDLCRKPSDLAAARGGRSGTTPCCETVNTVESVAVQ